MTASDTELNPTRRIGLALSGGGFRATLFHLGVIRCLRDYGLLHQVHRIVSVSGGSILAAHLSLFWHDWTSDDNNRFKNVQDAILQLTRSDLRNRVLRRLPLSCLYGWLSPLKDGTSTSILTWFYHRETYGKHLLRDLQVPVELLTTSLTVPEADTAFSNKGFHSERPGDPQRDEKKLVVHKIPCDTMPIAIAVAASSAFPGLFKPVCASTTLLNCKSSDMYPLPQYLSDGGVRDNLGGERLAKFVTTEDLNLLVLSDAGAAVDWLESDFTGGTLETLLRCFDVSQASRPRPNPPEHPPSVRLGIADAEPSRGSRLDGNQLKQLTKIRTDLDAFTRFEEWCLMSHGYAVARAGLKKYLGAGREGAFQPWQEEGVEVPSDITAALHESSRRSARKLVPDLRDWPALCAWIVALALLASGLYFGVPWVGYKLRQGYVWVAERYLPAPDVDSIRFERYGAVAGQVGLREHQIDPLAQDTLNYTYRGLNAVKGSAQELKVFEQTGVLPCTRPSTLQIAFTDADERDTNVKARDGKAFLVVPGVDNDSLSIRELALPKEQDGRLNGTVELPMTTGREFLVFLLVLEPKVPNEAIPTNYELRLN